MGKEKPSFEQSLLELENIVRQIEDENTSLDESIKLFERGIKLSGDCKKTLDTAKQKIILLTEVESEQNDD